MTSQAPPPVSYKNCSLLGYDKLLLYASYSDFALKRGFEDSEKI